MSAHTCHARNCEARVPPRMFMCRKHWFMIPKPMQDELWAAYVLGQERRMDPTFAYIDVAARLIAFVAEKESAS